jgi:hypothetical protein
LLKSGPDKNLSNGDIVSGLKNALEVGTTNTVELTGKVDGTSATRPSRFSCPDSFSRWSRGFA